MRVDSEGYATGYAQDLVLNCANKAAVGIRRAIEEHGPGIAVVVRGNSGVSCAFAALMQQNFNLCLLRKERDGSHGSPLEGPMGFRFTKYVVLDDFISSGATVDGIIRDLGVLADAKGDAAPQCVGIVLYGSERGGYNSCAGYLPNYAA